MFNFMLIVTLFMYLISVICPWLPLGLILSCICLGIILFTFFTVSRFVRLLGSIFLLLGVVMLWRSQASFFEYITSFGSMLQLLALFGLVPILAFPIKLGDYASGIQDLIQRHVKKSKHLYMMTSSISYFLSIFMNVATVPMTYYAIKPVLEFYPLQNENRFISRAITHGFTMPLMWSPITPVVGVALSLTGVSWLSILPYVLPLSLFGLALDWFLGAKVAKKALHKSNPAALYNHELAASIEENKPKSTKRILHIVVGIILLNGILILAEHYFSLSFITIVSLLVIPFSCSWCLLINKGKEFRSSLKEYVGSFSNKMKEQFFIYLAAGFFISAIQTSKTDLVINSWMVKAEDMIGGTAFLLIIPIVPVICSFIGLHPTITLSLMAEALNPSLLGISANVLTVIMLIGAVSAFLVGPFNTTIGLMSSIVKESSFKVSNWNIVYTLSYLFCGIIYIFLIKMILQA
ncbi:MAG: hypothetical protein ABF649_20415 [Bacillus sp. (in: firmicutes)]